MSHVGPNEAGGPPLRLLTRARIARRKHGAEHRQLGADEDGLLRHTRPCGENGRFDERGNGAGRGRRVASGNCGGNQPARERTDPLRHRCAKAGPSHADAVFHECPLQGLQSQWGRACEPPPAQERVIVAGQDVGSRGERRDAGTAERPLAHSRREARLRHGPSRSTAAGGRCATPTSRCASPRTERRMRGGATARRLRRPAIEHTATEPRYFPRGLMTQGQAAGKSGDNLFAFTGFASSFTSLRSAPSASTFNQAASFRRPAFHVG